MYLNFMLYLLLVIMLMIFKFKDSFLMILIGMEFLVVVVLIFILNYELGALNEWFFLFYIVFSVCESVVGLSILINLIYYYGDQGVMIISLSW